MGCIQSAGTSPGEVLANAAINRDIIIDSKENKRIIKLLMIGAGDSGKTTLRKQMRCIYGQGFNEKSRKDMRVVIMENIIEGIIDIMSFAANPNGEKKDKDSIESSIKSIFGSKGEAFLKLRKNSPSFFEAKDSSTALSLWKEDDFFKDALSNRVKFHLQDNWEYFMEQLENFPAWGGPKWVPSKEDCIRARVRTSGIIEEDFSIENVKFKLIDCGGQRAERKKWIHSFDNVTSILFVASLSEYDAVLFEDHKRNRLVESLELFSDICNSKHFSKIPVLLFLNKKDLFEEKFGKKKIPLNSCNEKIFANAPITDDVNVAIDWISSLFKERIYNKSREIFVHRTTAVDASNVRTVFELCRHIILKQTMTASGFLE